MSGSKSNQRFRTGRITKILPGPKRNRAKPINPSDPMLSVFEGDGTDSDALDFSQFDGQEGMLGFSEKKRGGFEKIIFIAAVVGVFVVGALYMNGTISFPQQANAAQDDDLQLASMESRNSSGFAGVGANLHASDARMAMLDDQMVKSKFKQKKKNRKLRKRRHSKRYKRGRKRLSRQNRRKRRRRRRGRG